ncbi:MAG: RidA family protein [Acidobacteriaceae bacterium]|nr:RidA family protein [Acidobacteriaceae bacterium]
MPVRALLSLTAICFVLVAASTAQRNRKSTEEPKTQVLPLPPDLPMALQADTATLDFHISPLLRTGGLSAQIRQSLNDLIRDTRGETIVKLRAFVAGAGDARRVQVQAAEIFTERKLPLPTLTIIQVGALEEEAAQVVIEGVVSTRKNVNPNGLAFFSGQTGSTYTQALQRLEESAKTASVGADRILRCTCFTASIYNAPALRGVLHAAFPSAAVNIVQPLRDAPADNTLCEAVGQLTQSRAEGEVVLMKNARITLVHSPKLVFTGLQLTFGNFLDDAQEAVLRLQRAASALQPVETPVAINAFALDASAASAVRKRMTAVPSSTFTVQTVEGLPALDATAGIEAVLAPNVAAPVTIAQ